MQRRARFSGLGTYVPPRVVGNDDLSRLMDTSDDWITQRTGIKERRWVDADTSTSDLAVEAANAAMADAGITADDVDMIIVATLSPDHEFPGTACFVQEKLDRPGVPAIDVRQQCTGFIYASSIADQFLRTGFADRVLMVGAEVHSKGLDISTEGRDVSVLFGDGAGAVVMEAVEVADPATDQHLFSTHLHADGRGAKELWLPAPGMAFERFMSQELLDAGRHFPEMNGRQVFVNAVKRMGEAVVETAQFNDVPLEAIDLFFFHQANLRINEAVGERLGLPEEKVYNTIQRFGNTTAATIPIGMQEAVADGMLEPGMLVCAAAFGSGFTWGSMLFRW